PQDHRPTGSTTGADLGSVALPVLRIGTGPRSRMNDSRPSMRTAVSFRFHRFPGHRPGRARGALLVIAVLAQVAWVPTTIANGDRGSAASGDTPSRADGPMTDPRSARLARRPAAQAAPSSSSAPGDGAQAP